MPYDGNGNYIRTHNWTADAANSLDISATEMDQEDNSIAAALSNAVTRDGQGKMGVDFLPNADNTLNLGSGALRWLSLNGTPIAQIIPTQQGIGGLLNPRTAAEIAASVTPTNFQFAPGPYIDARRYGTDPTGVADSTAAIQAAINVAQATSGGGATGATVILAPGTYKVTSQLLISGNRIRLIGAGRYATYILFAPTGGGICLKLANGATTINQCYLSDFTIFSNDSTFTKTALDVTDESGCTYERLVIGGGVVAGGASYWSGAGSIGVRIHGRDTSGFRDLTVFADKPLVISTNPHSAAISIDHHNFHNCFLGGNGFPIVTIEPGVVLTQVSFTGFQAWVVGAGGLYWVDATTPGPSNGLLIENLRYENSTDVTQYAIHIDVGSQLNSLRVGMSQTGASRGFYLRNLGRVTIENFYYIDATREAFNADNSVAQVKFINCFWQTGSTATLTNLHVSFSRATNTSGPVPSDGYLLPTPTASAPDFDVSDSVLGGNPFTLAAAATQLLGAGSTLCLMVVMSDSDQIGAFYQLAGTTHLTFEISDVGSFFSVTKGTANSFNIYWEPTALSGAGAYLLQNSFGVSKTLRVMRFGRS